MTLELVARSKTPSSKLPSKNLFSTFSLTIAQRFNAGSRSEEKSKSHQGRKKRVPFAEANWAASFVPERDFVWCVCHGPSVETLGYCHLRQLDEPTFVTGRQTTGAFRNQHFEAHSGIKAFTSSMDRTRPAFTSFNPRCSAASNAASSGIASFANNSAISSDRAGGSRRAMAVLISSIVFITTRQPSHLSLPNQS
jgi:hypothetical protein